MIMNQAKYIRQTNLPQVGVTGQTKLANAKVLVIGAGGLGCAVLPYLVSAGIGSIGIVDGDVVELSNLHRQVLYTEDSIGNKKVVEAKEKLKNINKEATITSYPYYLNAEEALRLFPEYDIILDATDTIHMRYLINDACIIANKPFVYGSVYRFEGQVSVFNFKNGPTYRCLFKNEKGIVQNCAEVGVMGTTVGMIGMFQANEVIKVILGIGDILSGKLLTYNALSSIQTIFNFSKDHKKQIDLEFYNSQHNLKPIQSISAQEALKAEMMLLDVREWEETPKIKYKGIQQIPSSKLNEEYLQLNPDIELAIFCQSGKRSKSAAQFLYKKGFKKVKNIQEGAPFLKILIDEKKEKSIH